MFDQYTSPRGHRNCSQATHVSTAIYIETSQYDLFICWRDGKLGLQQLDNKCCFYCLYISIMTLTNW